MWVSAKQALAQSRAEQPHGAKLQRGPIRSQPGRPASGTNHRTAQSRERDSAERRVRDRAGAPQSNQLPVGPPRRTPSQAARRDPDRELPERGRASGGTGDLSQPAGLRSRAGRSPGRGGARQPPRRNRGRWERSTPPAPVAGKVPCSPSPERVAAGRAPAAPLRSGRALTWGSAPHHPPASPF